MVLAVLPDIPGRPGAIMFATATAIATAVAPERLQGDTALLSTPLNLIFPDNTLLPVRLVLDPVLKHVACFRKLPDHLVGPLASAISAEIGRKVQGLPNGKFVRCHVLLQQMACRRDRQHATISERYSVWRLTAEVLPCCPRSSS
jgi:hypothetical protein